MGNDKLSQYTVLEINFTSCDFGFVLFLNF